MKTVHCYVKTLLLFCYVKAVVSTELVSTGRYCFTSVISLLLCYVKILSVLCEDIAVVM